MTNEPRDPTPPAIPPDVLLQEIERRAHLPRRKTKSRTASQAKSELALLLHEAQRTEAYRAWGYRNLGEAAARFMGVSPDAFNKYVGAGRRLLEYFEKDYWKAVIAFASGGSRPSLTSVSHLAAMPRRKTGAEIPAALPILLNDSPAPVHVTKALFEEQRYGQLGQRGRSMLKTLDEFHEFGVVVTQHCEQMAKDAKARPDLRQLEKRVGKLKEMLTTLVDAVATLDDQLHDDEKNA